MDTARSNQQQSVAIVYLILGLGIFFPGQLGPLVLISAFVPAVAMIHVAWWIIRRRIYRVWAIFPFAFWGAFLNAAIASRYEAGQVNSQIVSSNKQASKSLSGNWPLVFSRSFLPIELGYRYKTAEIYIENGSKNMVVLRDDDCKSATGSLMGSGKHAACERTFDPALPSIAIRVSTPQDYIPIADEIGHRRFNTYQFFRVDLTSPDGTTHSIKAAKTGYVSAFPAIFWSCGLKDLACHFMWAKRSVYLGSAEPIVVTIDKGRSTRLDAAIAHAFEWPSRL